MATVKSKWSSSVYNSDIFRIISIIIFNSYVSYCIHHLFIRLVVPFHAITSKLIGTFVFVTLNVVKCCIMYDSHYCIRQRTTRIFVAQCYMVVVRWRRSRIQSHSHNNFRIVVATIIFKYANLLVHFFGIFVFEKFIVICYLHFVFNKFSMDSLFSISFEALQRELRFLSCEWLHITLIFLIEIVSSHELNDMITHLYMGI